VKVVYLAHPVKGLVKKNIRTVVKIVRTIAHENSFVMPVAPYVEYNLALDDHIKSDRRLGMLFNKEFFMRRFIDELWLYGWKISEGMWQEIKLAKELGIPVVAKTSETEKALKKGQNHG